MIDALDNSTADLLDTMNTLVNDEITPAQANAVVAKAKKKRVKYNIKTDAGRAKVPAGKTVWHTISPHKAIGWRAYEVGGIFKCRNGHIFTLPNSQGYSWEDALTAALAHFSVADAPVTTTVQDAVDSYVRDLRIRRGIYCEVESRKRLERLCEDLMAIPVHELTVDTLRNWFHSLKGAASTRNRVKSMLFAVLNASDIDPLITRKIKSLPTGDTSRNLLLSTEDVQKLIDASTGSMHYLTRYLSETGTRLGEVRNADRQDVDFTTGKMHLSGKTGVRDIILRSETLEWLKDVAPGRDGSLIPSDSGCRYKSGEHTYAFRRVVKDADVDPDCVMYSLRHAFLSRCVNSGISALPLAKYCGTSVLMLEKHYYHQSDEEQMVMINAVSL